MNIYEDKGKVKEFSRHLKIWRSQVNALLKRKNESPLTEDLLIEAFEEISIALEELTVAEEELRQQNENLAKAQIQIAAEHQRYLDLFEFAPDAYLLTNPVGKIEEANRAATNLLNIAPNYLVGKPLVIFIVEQEHPNFYAKLANLEQVDCIGEWEVGIVPRNRKQIEAAITIASVRDRSGKLIAIRWLLRDITQRKLAALEHAELLAREQEARKEAQAAQARISNILESINDAFVTVNTQWRLTYVNSQAAKILGKTVEELISSNLWDVFPATTDSQTYALSHQALSEQVSVEYEEFYPIWDKWFALRLYPCQEGLSVYFLDITDRKQTEEALRQSESRFRRLVESNIIGSIVGNFNGNITEANDAFLEMVGYTKEDLRSGKLRWNDMTPREYLLQDEQAIAQVKASGTCIPYEKEFIRADGNRIPTLTGLALLEGSTDSSIYFVLDLTQIKQLEITLRQQAEELTQVNHIKDEFLAIVSHELRSPLSAILGWAQMLRTGSLNTTMTARAIDVIERSAKAQTQLIDDLLDVSQIITGKLRMNVRSVELAPIINRAINTVRPAADAKLIQIQSQFDLTTPTVLADAERLQQVVWNLLVNAIKFTPEGGYIKIETRQSWPQPEYNNSYVEIIVSDTGIGIKPEFLPFVFERFRQGDATITRTYGGMGLGLAIVRHLIEMHGGTVSVTSQGIAQGTTFTIRLPLIAVRSKV